MLVKTLIKKNSQRRSSLNTVTDYTEYKIVIKMQKANIIE